MKEEKSEQEAKRSPEALRMTDDPAFISNIRRWHAYLVL
jgi:hypothetical protein